MTDQVPGQPHRGAPGSEHLERPVPSGTDIGEATMVQPALPSRVERPAGGVLGVVVIYSERAKGSEPRGDPQLGVVYPLRDGEILLFGRERPDERKEVERRDGRRVPPTHGHFVPSGGVYQGVSRSHLTIEFDPNGETVLTDLSQNGIYLESARLLHRAKIDGVAKTIRIRGAETVLPMASATPDAPESAQLHSRIRLQVLPSPRLGQGTKAGDST